MVVVVALLMILVLLMSLMLLMLLVTRSVLMLLSLLHVLKLVVPCAAAANRRSDFCICSAAGCAARSIAQLCRNSSTASDKNYSRTRSSEFAQLPDAFLAPLQP